MADQLEQLREHVQIHLDAGDELVAAVTASPRGRSTATAAGGIGSMIGYGMASGQVRNAEQVGLRVVPNVAIVLTTQRLITLEVSYSAGGTITGVKRLLSAVPLGALESIEARRAGLGGLLVLNVRGGNPIKLECRVSRAREFAAAFNHAAVGA